MLIFRLTCLHWLKYNYIFLDLSSLLSKMHLIYYADFVDASYFDRRRI